MEEIEDVTKVSSKGQVVIPKEIRDRLEILPGEKIIVMTRGEEIVLRKARKLSLEELSEKIASVVEKKKVNVDKLVDEAIRWARSKQS
ncbi:MAG: AbrB/MazE/SpoVT family DNA-binding domain-containing protein [Thaumarchaeota archaeon]|jgi:AbrB family looped-hinge helix DNA binding protein|nr:AbrB/MazE/SpoVT family DNA-binding domain-containing protein [Nitrososphaerota archaeon]